MVGACVFGDDERKILLKLEKEGVLKILYPEDRALIPVLRKGEHPLSVLRSIRLQLVPKIEKYYSKKCGKFIKQIDKKKSYNKKVNWICYTSPVWFLYKLVIVAWRKKIISSIIILVIGGLVLAYIRGFLNIN